ncbi:hypothetical protein CI610_02314 [invertebrate metagenome]|uniref:Uncharacterized protein n=1 Tax=invertebrate metagenome TaxID=1711999 RepID=A0A2H9T6B0_9ZZZZ
MTVYCMKSSFLQNQEKYHLHLQRWLTQQRYPIPMYRFGEDKYLLYLLQSCNLLVHGPQEVHEYVDTQLSQPLQSSLFMHYHSFGCLTQ